jgi:hypothetical protein
MANEVYANNEEVACKAADGKSICCFPDVCMTPPENPATPPGVPVPYPNTGLASDTTDGTRSVQISGKEVMLKNKSYFKKSMGDEAGCAAKKGVVTSVNRGKIYFITWSMDVKVESENVVRHLDMTTHNHASPVTNTGSWIYADRMAMAGASGNCDDQIKAVQDNCTVKDGKVECTSDKAVDNIKKAKSMPKGNEKNAALREAFAEYHKEIASDDCQNAARCLLSKKNPSSCCPPQTPHHVVPASQFKDQSGRQLYPGNKPPDKPKRYSYQKAPCICVEGNNQTQASHGLVHFNTKTKTREHFKLTPTDPFPEDERWSCLDAEAVGAAAVCEEFPHCGPNCLECMKAQLRKHHQDMNIDASDPIRPTIPGPVEAPAIGPSLE